MQTNKIYIKGHKILDFSAFFYFVSLFRVCFDFTVAVGCCCYRSCCCRDGDKILMEMSRCVYDVLVHFICAQQLHEYTNLKTNIKCTNECIDDGKRIQLANQPTKQPMNAIHWAQWNVPINKNADISAIEWSMFLKLDIDEWRYTYFFQSFLDVQIR